MPNLKDPNYDPKGNPHKRYDAAKAALLCKDEQAANERKVQVEEKPNPVRSSTGNILDPVTAEMKEKIEAERRARKQAPVAAAPVNAEEAEQIVMILVEAFEQQHADVFHAVPAASGKGYSKFNATQFIHYHLSIVSRGLGTWSPASMEKSFQYLLANNYFEKPTRTRGESAPKVVPIWKPPVKPEVVTQAEAIQRNRTEISVEENKRLREMPLSELKKQAQANYKPDPNQKVTRI